MPFDVVVVGEINADLILRGNVDPVFGQVEQVVDDAHLVIGSSGSIFACGAARLGLKTAIIGKVGDDLFGKFMIEALHAKQVDTTGVVIDPDVSTGFSVILAKEEDRAILTFMGAIPALNYSEIDFSLIANSRHLHLGSFFMLKNLRSDVPELFRKAKERGLTVSMDTNYDPLEQWDHDLEAAFRHVDIFLPNDTEAKAIAGHDDLDGAMDILGKKVSLLVVKQGALGAVVKSVSGNTIKQRPLPVDVVDTVGAGDSFDAGFIYGYLKKWHLKQTLKLAVACGSLSTRLAGGTEAQAEITEAVRLMEQLND